MEPTHNSKDPRNAETLHKPPSAKQLDHYDGYSQPALEAVEEQLSRGGEDRHYCTFVTFVFCNNVNGSRNFR